MRRIALLAIGLALAACTPMPDTGLPMRLNTASAPQIDLPAVQRFGPAPLPVLNISNADIVRDFLDLTFQLESGRAVERFTRFEGPIGVRLAGNPPPTLVTDLDALLQRLRTEVGIDIARNRPGPNQITINAIPRVQVHAALPEAACFVIPNLSTYTEFRQARRRGTIDWTRLKERREMAIFLPNDVAPQEIRDCLHEELAQALGPVNDLYRLPNSVFNDDNIHRVLTRFDMLILRMTYDDALQNGMSQSDVAARLPEIIARLNPAGARIVSRPAQQTPRLWITGVQRALGPGTTPQERRQAAAQTLRIAQQAGWQDNRLGYAHYILGRLSAQSDPRFAYGQFLAADRIFAADPSLQAHRALSTAQLAAVDLQSGQPNTALARLVPAIATARVHQNAALLATLLLLQAQALDDLGQTAQAGRVRLDSLGWARYGFGTAGAVLDKAKEVASLSPANRS